MPFSNFAQQRSFVQSIINDPNNLELRLIYADWLEENGYDEHSRRVRANAECQRLHPELVDVKGRGKLYLLSWKLGDS